MSLFQNRQLSFWLEHSTLVLFLAIIGVFGLLSPQFFTLSNLANMLIQSSSLAIIAIGMTFVLLTAGIDLSVGSIMFLVGVVSGKMVVAGQPVWLACLVALVIGTLFGLLNAIFIDRLKMVPFIVTLATLFAGRGLGLWVTDTRAINLPDTFLEIGSSRVLGLPFPIIVLVLVVILAHVMLSYTALGRQVYAVGHSPEKARKAGLPVDRIIILVYVICGFCAALGGLVALAQLGAVSPTFGQQREFMAIAAAVLGGSSLFGGRGKVFPGTLLGAVLIQALQSGLVMINADPYLYPLITGAVIFFIVWVDSARHARQEQLSRLQTHPKA